MCGERAVNIPLASAMGRLKVDNTLAAAQRACGFGVIRRGRTAHYGKTFMDQALTVE